MLNLEQSKKEQPKFSLALKQIAFTLNLNTAQQIDEVLEEDDEYIKLQNSNDD